MTDNFDKIIHDLEVDYMWRGDPTLYYQVIQARILKQVAEQLPDAIKEDSKSKEDDE